jgi:hypothetical protein
LKATGPSFVGTVIDIENPPDDRRGALAQSGLSRYRFRVDENISGFEEKEVDVYSGRGTGDCSYHFRMGQSYFVAPYKAELNDLYGTEPGKLVAVICTETQPAANASALLAELRARKRGSTVEGVLRTKQHDVVNANGQKRSVPLQWDCPRNVPVHSKIAPGFPAARERAGRNSPVDYDYGPSVLRRRYFRDASRPSRTVII